jgi:4-hydroxybenzoate polyprenyltransferase
MIKEYLNLIRIRQWYKNLVIFLPLFFVGEVFAHGYLEATLVGFIALCFVSSANYVLNDIIDRKSDREHPEKKMRPLASGKINIASAYIVFLIMLIAGLYIAYTLDLPFLICAIFLFVFTIIYSLFLKKEPVADVLSIAINFVVRAVSGTFIIHTFISPWLIFCPFFLALFLGFGKRNADLRFMKTKAHAHKEVLKYYTLENTNALMTISTTCLIIAYALYSFSRTTWLLLTLPFAIYAIFHYYALVQNGSEIARHPEKIYRDWRLMLSIALIMIILFIIFYVLIPNVEPGALKLW